MGVVSQTTKGILLRGMEGLPIQIPQEILDYQAVLGPKAALLWINLVAMAQLREPLKLNILAEQMGLPEQEVSQLLALLDDRGWINDEGIEIKLTIPVVEEAAAAAEESILDEEQASFEWLVNYWTTRVAAPTPEEMRKLLYWMETKGLSHEVIAVAIEEMRVSAKSPGFAYLEGILRNWHALGIRSYNDLLENPHLTKVLQPIAAKKELSRAEERWKEVFPDEFD